ncbi:MAG: chromate transporter [Acidisphaera sp.]|nr:chromate transporter [Acidisphaera sp.]MBV9812399.1 chromate transporter [Acetobacteraceae bacterium]
MGGLRYTERVRADPPPHPGLRALFAGFFEVGMLGFGGVLPLARRMIVERRRWLTAPEFTDLLALCQFLPGGNIINVSVTVGLRFRGVPGALAALLGLLAAPTAVALALAAVYMRTRDEPAVRRLFAGLAAAAAGLVLATAIKIARPLIGQPRALAVAVAVLALIAVAQTPMLPTMLVMMPVGILLVRPSQ